MEFSTVILILSGLFLLSAVFATTALYFYSSKKKNRVKDMVSGVLAGGASEAMAGAKKQTRVLDVEEIKRESKKLNDPSSRSKLQATEVYTRQSVAYDPPNLEDQKFFQAGIYTTSDKLLFKRFQLISPVVVTCVAVALLLLLGVDLLLLVAGAILSLFIGITLPQSWLERKIRAREDETLAYLPIAIEQISIGVSSSLDLWPCIAHILEMSRNRDTFNPVTELFIHIERLIISGLSFPEALQEVGQASGVQQVKHTFQFLSQCAEHGGEISKQLQELANSIMTERQTQVEAKISSLPVKATGPLFLVFAGFFALMLAGIFSRLLGALAFGGS
jgi:Flp pilus assembly protein TadB